MSRTSLIALPLALAGSLALGACGADAADPEPAPATATTSSAAQATVSSEPTVEATSAPETGGEGASLPLQTIGAAPDCSPWSLESVGQIWGVTLVDTDEGQVTEVNGPGTFHYSCDYNETDSGLGLTVIVEVKEYLSADEAIQSMTNTRDGASFGDTVYYLNEEVAGVADEAFYSIDADDESNPTPMQVQLYARQGNTVFLLTALDLDGLADAQAAKQHLVETLQPAVG